VTTNKKSEATISGYLKTRLAETKNLMKSQDFGRLLGKSADTVLSQGFYYEIVKLWMNAGFRFDQFVFIDGEQLISSPWKELSVIEAELGLKQEFGENKFWFNEITGFWCMKKSECNTDFKKYENCGCMAKRIGKTRGNNNQAKLDEQSSSLLQQLYQNDTAEFFKIVGNKWKDRFLWRKTKNWN